MPIHDVFLSLVIVVEDATEDIEGLIKQGAEMLRERVTDYELILVDNASGDDTVARLGELVDSVQNVQVYCLLSRVDRDIALLAGMEQAIGDYVALIDPDTDHLSAIPAMLDAALDGNDLVLAVREGGEQDTSVTYNFLSRVYIRMYRGVTGYDLRRDSPRFRLMSRRVVNFVLQHEAAYLISQTIPMGAGFRRCLITYSGASFTGRRPAPSVSKAATRALSMLVVVSSLPIRLVSLICLLAASLSLLYSGYVVLTYLFRSDVVPGWTTLSLQVSGMFFLMSLAIAILSEYLVQVSTFSARRPVYHIVREFRSTVFTREQKLNVLRQEDP